jgi:hypothetical protein
VWGGSAADRAYPDYCRMWDVCETCEHAAHSNVVFQAHDEYELTPQSLTWAEAGQFCQSHGGQLASIHSAEDQANVWAVARGFRVWIGLNDREGTPESGSTGAEGTWVWTVCMFLLLVISSADKFLSCARLMNMITSR